MGGSIGKQVAHKRLPEAGNGLCLDQSGCYTGVYIRQKKKKNHWTVYWRLVNFYCRFIASQYFFDMLWLKKRERGATEKCLFPKEITNILLPEHPGEPVASKPPYFLGRLRSQKVK